MGKFKGKTDKREFILCDDEQEYALVLNVLGDCRFLVKLLHSGQEIIGHVRGNMRSKNRSSWVRKDDIVIVSKRDFQADKVEIVHKYLPDEVRKLVKMGHIDLDTEKEESFWNTSESDDDLDVDCI